MLRSAALLATAFLASTISAAPAFTGQPLEIRDLVVGKVMGGNVTISFSVHDPDPLTDAEDTCEGEWRTASKAFPKGSYALCSNRTTFGWHMEEFDTIESFTLGLEHKFTDPSLNDPPYNQVTNFANITLDSENFPCKVDGNTTTCKQNVKVLKAPIYATIAKKR